MASLLQIYNLPLSNSWSQSDKKWHRHLSFSIYNDILAAGAQYNFQLTPTGYRHPMCSAQITCTTYVTYLTLYGTMMHIGITSSKPACLNKIQLWI